MPTTVRFNRNPFTQSQEPVIVEPTQRDIKTSPQLVNASLDDALRYGGDIAREVIGVAPLKFDRKYIVVDTKVHMLLPGMSPAIPGWHNDGSPRDEKFSPVGKGKPDLVAQETLRAPRYHILVTSGGNSLTEFLQVPFDFPLEGDPYQLYARLSKYVNDNAEFLRYEDDVAVLKPNHLGKFDWWNVHRGVPATTKGWRYFIRICETDYLEPWTDLRDILRTQVQVYAPANFGW